MLQLVLVLLSSPCRLDYDLKEQQGTREGVVRRDDTTFEPHPEPSPRTTFLPVKYLSPSMDAAAGSSSSSSQEDPFVGHVAVQLSRALNSISVNALLARRVIDIASSNPSVATFKKALSAFGKITDAVVEELHTEILVHLSQQSKGGKINVSGFAVHDEHGPDMLEEEKNRGAGGLVRGGGSVSPLPSMQRHLRVEASSKLTETSLWLPLVLPFVHFSNTPTMPREHHSWDSTSWQLKRRPRRLPNVGRMKRVEGQARRPRSLWTRRPTPEKHPCSKSLPSLLAPPLVNDSPKRPRTDQVCLRLLEIDWRSTDVSARSERLRPVSRSSLRLRVQRRLAD